MVVALGIYIGKAAPDAALVWGEELSVLPLPATPSAPDTISLRAIVDSATEHHGRSADRIALSYPASWDPLRVDRLLRSVRSSGVAVDRYLTSGEAAVRWWRHVAGVAAPGAATVLVHDVMAGSSELTLVRMSTLDIETIASREVELHDVSEVARRFVESARLSLSDLAPMLTVGSADSGYEHAVALGAALAATI